MLACLFSLSDHDQIRPHYHCGENSIVIFFNRISYPLGGGGLFLVQNRHKENLQSSWQGKKDNANKLRMYKPSGKFVLNLLRHYEHKLSSSKNK